MFVPCEKKDKNSREMTYEQVPKAAVGPTFISRRDILGFAATFKPTITEEDLNEINDYEQY